MKKIILSLVLASSFVAADGYEEVLESNELQGSLIEQEISAISNNNCGVTSYSQNIKHESNVIYDSEVVDIYSMNAYKNCRSAGCASVAE